MAFNSCTAFYITYYFYFYIFFFLIYNFQAIIYLIATSAFLVIQMTTCASYLTFSYFVAFSLVVLGTLIFADQFFSAFPFNKQYKAWYSVFSYLTMIVVDVSHTLSASSSMSLYFSMVPFFYTNMLLIMTSEFHNNNIGNKIKICYIIKNPFFDLIQPLMIRDQDYSKLDNMPHLRQPLYAYTWAVLA